LLALGPAYSVHNAEELIQKVDFILSNKDNLASASQSSLNYVAQGCGATQIVMQGVKKLLG